MPSVVVGGAQVGIGEVLRERRAHLDRRRAVAATVMPLHWSPMPRSTVAILKTQPSTVLDDYHELLNLGGYQQVVDKTVDTVLKVNISWHFFFPGSSTTPWQLDGVIRAMKADGYDLSLAACLNPHTQLPVISR